MTRDETGKILNTLFTLFPAAYKHVSGSGQKEILLNQWWEHLKPYPYAVVRNVVDKHVAASNYAPSISEILAMIHNRRRYDRTAPVDCEICGGLGGIIYYRYHTDAPCGWYEHMAVCTCEAGERLPFRGRLQYNVNQLRNLLAHDKKFRLQMPLNNQQTEPEELPVEKENLQKVIERLKVMIHAE